MSAGKGGVTGGAKKVVGFVVAVFALMVVVPVIGPMMDVAGQLGAALVEIVGAITGVIEQISNAFAAAGGEQ